MPKNDAFGPEAGNLTFDITRPAAEYTRVKDVPLLRGTHPSISPDSRLMVTDGMTESLGGPAGERGIQVADLNGGESVMIHRFDCVSFTKWGLN